MSSGHLLFVQWPVLSERSKVSLRSTAVLLGRLTGGALMRMLDQFDVVHRSISVMGRSICLELRSTGLDGFKS